MNTHVVSDDCNPMAIVTTTVFRTTNVSVVAPYFGIIDSSLEGEEDLILTVERYVHMCFVVPDSSCSTVLMLSGPAFAIHFSLIPNSPQVTFNIEGLHPFIHCISFSHARTPLRCPVSPLSAFFVLHWSCNINHWNRRMNEHSNWDGYRCSQIFQWLWDTFVNDHVHNSESCRTPKTWCYHRYYPWPTPELLQPLSMFYERSITNIQLTWHRYEEGGYPNRLVLCRVRASIPAHFPRDKV